MRRSLGAIHLVSLALWLGSLAFTFFLAPALFRIAKPICPTCHAAIDTAHEVGACVTCGALHHPACQGGCSLEHAGSHDLRVGPAISSIATSSLAVYERVRLRHDRVTPERRLLWKIDATSGALDPAKGEVPGACFELPREATGDALARAFELSSALSIVLAIAALLTVLLTPPGGALRLLRVAALAASLGLAIWGLSLGHAVAEKRLLLETSTAAGEETRKEFGATHGLAFLPGLGQAVLVLVALVLSAERRERPNEA